MTQKTAFWLLVCILFGLLTRIYLPSFNNPFNFDDQHTIVDNLPVRSLENVSRFFTDPRTVSVLPSNQVYRPLLTLSIAVDYYIAGGLFPRTFHRSMYLVFCLQLIATFFLYRSIFKKVLANETESFIRFASLLTTAVYGYNTALVETLDYTIARSDSYSTFFAVVTLAMFAHGGLFRRYHLYLIPLVLGALTKETGATVTALIFVFDFLITQKGKLWPRLKASFIATIPSAIAVALYLALYVSISIAAPPQGTTRLPYFVTQIYVTAHYMLMFFLPVHLSADSDLKPFIDLFDERALLAGVLHLVLIYFCIKGVFNRKYAPLSFGLAWFYIALSPTSSLIPIEDVQNDHRMFYPFVGVAIAVGWIGLLAYKNAVEKLGMKIANILLVLIMTGYLSGHCYGLTQRHEVWSSKEKLWHDVTIKSPNNARGLMNYGIQLMQRGDYAGARNYYNRALKIWPNYPYLHLNLGIVNGAENRDVEADREFKLAIQFNPYNPTAYLFYANWLKTRQRYLEALTNVDKVLSLSPDYMGAKELREEVLKLSKP